MHDRKSFTTGGVFTSVADATRADARTAIEAAEAAFPAWSSLSHAVGLGLRTIGRHHHPQ